MVGVWVRRVVVGRGSEVAWEWIGVDGRGEGEGWALDGEGIVVVELVWKQCEGDL